MKFLLVVFSIISLFFVANISSFAQQNYVDSLEHIVRTSQGEDKIKALHKISNYMLREYQGIESVNRLIEEAKKQSNHKYMGMGYRSKANYYDSLDETDSVISYVNKSKDEFRIVNDTAALASVDFILIGTSLRQGKTELVLHLADKFLNDKTHKNYLLQDVNIAARLYSSMGIAYAQSNRQEEAIETFRMGIDAIRDKEHQKDIDFHFYTAIAISAIRDKNFDLATVANDSMNIVIEGLSKSNSYSQGTIDMYKFICLYTLADIYLSKKDQKNARIELDKTKALLSDNIYDQYRYIYYYLEAQYYYEQGNYNKSVGFLEPALNYFTLSVGAFTHFEICKFKAKLLGSMNKPEEALRIMETIYHQRDSINMQTQIEQMDVLQTIYKVDNMKAEIKARKATLRSVQTIVIGLICIILLLGILFVKSRQNAKIQNKKNKKLYDQLVEMDIYAGQIRTLNKQKLEEENQSLAYRIDSYLKESEDFRKASLSRSDLALRLGTNRQYLADAVKEATGKTFNDYINDMRLDYARIQLVENQLASVELILTESGFSTRATFNRLFRQRYGMTPIELRQVSVRKSSTIHDL